MDRQLTLLCPAAKVPLKGVVQIAIKGMRDELAVYNLDGEYFCTEDMCTHGMVSLSNGDVEDGQIFCPLHGGAFDIRSGKATEQPCRTPLKTYKVIVDGDMLYAELPIEVA